MVTYVSKKDEDALLINNPLDVLAESEKYETEIFFTMARKLYDDCAIQSKDLYRMTLKITDNFRNITPEMIVADSRIIKVLRYCMIPAISQMKLGQLVGLDTTSGIEDEKITKGRKLSKLKTISPKLCEIFNNYLDRQRFLWLQTELSPREYQLAIEYSENWTCSLISNQNSSTMFRNWRKELQETSAEKQIIEAGYCSVGTRPTISSIEDLLPGKFSRECRIVGRSIQKADLVVRLKKSKKLLIIEAKAIGVRIDSYKRIKECREKFDDWTQTFGDNAEVGVVLSGFIQESEVTSLIKEGVHLFWEYSGKDLYDYLSHE